MEPTGYGYHCGIVGRELELRQECGPAPLASFLLDPRTESAVCRNASSYGYLLDTRMFSSLYELVHQDVDKSLLEAGADVRLVLLHELRIDRHLIAYKIQQRGLYTAEAVVESWNMRLGELVFQRISFLGKPVHDRAAGIAKSHHLRTLVESLSYCIINSLAEDLIIQRTVHLHDLRVSSRNKKTQVRELRLSVFAVVLLDEICQNMALEVVDLDKRLVQRHCKTLGERSSDKKRAEQSGATCECYRRDV